jgi:hypothetical protein
VAESVKPVLADGSSPQMRTPLSKTTMRRVRVKEPLVSPWNE